MRRKLRDTVVVVTGASSGIGRATALALAQSGATVVLAARRRDALEEVRAQCEGLGGRALAVPTDVTDEGAVRALARRAVETFGRIDVWVNNAAVTLFGRFEEVPPDAFRRVMETNFFGYVHGARAVLPFFREQGTGVLINNASVMGVIGQPFTSAYASSKWAIRGFSESLRMELFDTDIAVCTVLPASIDTPLFQQGANYSGRTPKAISPVYPAELVAEAILELATKPEREVYVGAAGHQLGMMHGLAPGLAERLLARKVAKDHFQDRPAGPTPGNLFTPLPGWTSVSGGWRAPSPSKPVGKWIGAAAGATALVLFGLPLLTKVFGGLFARSVARRGTRAAKQLVARSAARRFVAPQVTHPGVVFSEQAAKLLPKGTAATLR